MNEEKFKKIFSQNLRYYMSLNDKTQIDLINDLKLNKSAVSTWCNGTRLPRMDKVDLLANYFGIRRSDLIEERTSVDTEPKLSQEETDIALAYRKASEDTKNAAAAVLGVRRKELSIAQTEKIG